MYDFFGQQDTATTFKLDAVSGALIWSIPSERTSSTPIVTPAHGVLLSAGISGFGSKNKVEQFLDQGATVAAGWDTAALDPNVILGGRTHQPAVARGYLYVGTPPDSGFFSPFSDLYIVDLARDPNEAGFIVDHSAGAGGSPALAQGRLFSIGSAGLVAFEPSASCAADFDGSGAVNISDLGSLLAAFGAARPDANFNADADIDLSGAVDITDLGALLAVFGETCE
jgi:outer membrane protein assembly factor BamB